MLAKISAKYILVLTFLSVMVISGKSYAVVHCYISNSGENTLSVLNADDYTAPATIIPLDVTPYGVATAPAGDFVYVTNRYSNTVSQVDTQTATVYKTHFVGTDPVGIAVSPDGIYVYVANQDGNLSVINTTDDSVTTVTVGTSLFGVDVSPDGSSIYVTDNTDNVVYEIAQEDFTVSTLFTVGAWPSGIAVTPSGYYVVVVNGGDSTVSLISTYDNVISDPITVGSAPLGVAITTDSGYAYITNTADDTVSKLSLYDFTVESILLTVEGDPLDYPLGVAMYPFGSFVYVVNSSAGTVKSITIDDVDIVSTDVFNVGYVPVGFGKFIPSEVPLDLTATLVGDTEIDISWTDNSDAETGFTIERKKFSGGAFEAIAWVGAGVTTYSDVGLGHFANYYYRVSAYNDFGSTIYSNEAFAQTIEEEYTGASCFIATAAYGSLLEPHVRLLRQFRDRYLVINQPGRAFLDMYYAYSPPIAQYIASNDFLRFLVRWSLLPLVAISWMSLAIGLLPTMFVLSALCGLASFVFVRRKQVMGKVVHNQ